MSLALLVNHPSLERIWDAIVRSGFTKRQVTGIAVGGYLTYKVARFLKFWFIDPQLSPLKNLPGPDSYDSLLWGDFRRILSASPSSIYEQWFAEYGHSYSYRGMFLVATSQLQYPCREKCVKNLALLDPPTLHKGSQGGGLRSQPQL